MKRKRFLYACAVTMMIMLVGTSLNKYVFALGTEYTIEDVNTDLTEPLIYEWGSSTTPTFPATISVDVSYTVADPDPEQVGGDDPAPGDDSGSGDTTGTGGNSESGDTTGTGGNSESGDTTGTGDDSGSGDTTGAGGDSGSGDTTGAGGNSESGDTSGTGDNSGSGDSGNQGDSGNSGDSGESGDSGDLGNQGAFNLFAPMIARAATETATVEVPVTWSTTVGETTKTSDQLSELATGDYVFSATVTDGDNTYLHQEIIPTITLSVTHTTHSYSYTPNGDELIVACTCACPTCPYYNHSAALTLVAEGGVYKESAYAAELSGEAALTQNLGLTVTDLGITYSPANPTDVGTYTATASFKVNNHPQTLTKTFSITAASQDTPDTPVIGATTYNSLTITNAVSGQYYRIMDNQGSGNEPWTICNVNGDYTVSNLEAGHTYNVYTKVAGDSNHMEAISEGAEAQLPADNFIELTAIPTIVNANNHDKPLVGDVLQTTASNATGVPYKWFAGNAVVAQGASKTSYTVTAADVGKAIKVVLLQPADASNDGRPESDITKPSAETDPVEKVPNASVPDAPTLREKSYNTITIEVEAGKEYIICDKDFVPNDDSWNAALKPAADDYHTFEGLDEETEYDIYVRFAGSDSALPSASTKHTVATEKKPAEPTEDQTSSEQSGSGNTSSSESSSNSDSSSSSSSSSSSGSSSSSIAAASTSTTNTNAAALTTAAQPTTSTESAKKSTTKKAEEKKAEDKVEDAGKTRDENQAENKEVAEPAQENVSLSGLVTESKITLGEGSVVVKMDVPAGSEISAGIADAKSVIESVLTPEQLELVKAGANVEIKVEATVLDKATIPQEDALTIEEGVDSFKNGDAKLAMGSYIDISLYLKFGDDNWNQLTGTKDPIEIVIQIPEEYKGLSDNYYIMRAHEGEYTLLYDIDDNPDTITIATGKFSTYALVYDNAISEVANVPSNNTSFEYWLYVIIIVLFIVIVGMVIYSINLKKRLCRPRHRYQ